MTTCNCPEVVTIVLTLPFTCVHKRNPPSLAASPAASPPVPLLPCDDCRAWMQAKTDGWPAASDDNPSCSCNDER